MASHAKAHRGGYLFTSGTRVATVLMGMLLAIAAVTAANIVTSHRILTTVGVTPGIVQVDTDDGRADALRASPVVAKVSAADQVRTTRAERSPGSANGRGREKTLAWFLLALRHGHGFR